MAKYQTEKRKANVGERILITDASETRGEYANGDIGTVRSHSVFDTLVYVKEWERSIRYNEYEVIVEQPKPTKNERITALETEVSELKAKVEALEKAQKYPLTSRFDAETNTEADRIMAQIKRKATPQTPNQQRADVIKRAKAYLEDAKVVPDFGGEKAYLSKADGSVVGYYCNVEFHVNNDKRTVVALLKWRFNGAVKAKGIAKCDPSDVFNVDIGKAIALARALGVEVPSEFVKAVQPTEVVVGMKILRTHTMSGATFVMKIHNDEKAQKVNERRINRSIRYKSRIIEDTDAVYE